MSEKRPSNIDIMEYAKVRYSVLTFRRDMVVAASLRFSERNRFTAALQAENSYLFNQSKEILDAIDRERNCWEKIFADAARWARVEAYCRADAEASAAALALPRRHLWARVFGAIFHRLRDVFRTSKLGSKINRFLDRFSSTKT